MDPRISSADKPPTRLRRGGGASIARITYLDHTLFRGRSHSTVKPCLREAVGWIVRETDKALWLVFDRPVDPKLEPRLEDGLVILKSCIVELKRLGEGC